MAQKAKLPSFQFYPGDWRKDPDLSRCSKAAKGVWIDMLCLMFECEDRGVFATGGEPWTDEEIAAAIGGDTGANLACIDELLRKGVARRNDSGAIFSRRLVRDEQKRRARVQSGQAGGKASLDAEGFVYAIARATDGSIKLGASRNPSARRSQLASRSEAKLSLVRKWPVANMTISEKVIHGHFAQQHLGNEWFRIGKEDLKTVESLLQDANLLRAQSHSQLRAQNRGSSSSTSSSTSNTGTGGSRVTRGSNAGHPRPPPRFSGDLSEISEGLMRDPPGLLRWLDAAGQRDPPVMRGGRPNEINLVGKARQLLDDGSVKNKPGALVQSIKAGDFRISEALDQWADAEVKSARNNNSRRPRASPAAEIAESKSINSGQD